MSAPPSLRPVVRSELLGTPRQQWNSQHRSLAGLALWGEDKRDKASMSLKTGQRPGLPSTWWEHLDGRKPLPTKSQGSCGRRLATEKLQGTTAWEPPDPVQLPQGPSIWQVLGPAGCGLG